MSFTLKFRLSSLETKAVVNRKCPKCPEGKGQIHGHKERMVRDHKVSMVQSVRMKCNKCKRTWTLVPQGLTLGKRRTDRVIGLGILMYFLGLSYDKCVVVLETIGINETKVTLYNDYMESCQKAGAILQTARGKANILVKRAGVDGLWQKVKGEQAMGLLMLTDLDLDIAIEIAQVDEGNSSKVREQLNQWIKSFGIEVVMTDDHVNYRFLDDYESTGVKHWRCQAHFKKAKINRANELIEESQQKGYKLIPMYLEEAKSIVKALDITHVPRLNKLYDKVLRYKRKGSPHTRKKKPYSKASQTSVGYRTYKLVIDIMEKFGDLIDQDITTNNSTERLNGLLLKHRSKTMRGFENTKNISKFIWLSRWVREASRKGRVDLSMIV